MEQQTTAAESAASSEFRIEQLFGSRTRARLLALFLENADRAFYVRELTRRIDTQLNSVRRELKNLVDVGIVLEVEGTILPGERDTDNVVEAKNEKKKFYQANPNFPLFDDLRNVMRKAAVLLNTKFVRELGEKGTVDLVLLTGRFMDQAGVPTDILIVGDVPAQDLADVMRDFEHDIAREVNYTSMPKDEFLYRREVGDRFLATILQAKHVMLVNRLSSV